MERYEDILERLALVPREFAWLQLHVPPVSRRSNGRALATVWLQSAFEPTAPGLLRVLDATTDAKGSTEVARFDLPQPRPGEVIRWLLPFEVGEAIARLIFIPESTLPPKAARVRQPWKLFDTYEIPKLSEMTPVGSSPDIDMGASIAGSLLGSALTGGMFIFASGRNLTFGTAGEPPKTVVNAARDLGPGFLAEVAQRDVDTRSEPVIEHVWSPGEPLPEPATTDALPDRPTALAAQASATPDAKRTCFACGFEGSAAEYGKARSCPSCDAPWT